MANTAPTMRDQLAAGLALLAAASAAALAGLGWLAFAAALAAVPFLVAGAGFAVAGLRGRDRPAATRR